jgi:SAM-dependent methyltransferase
VTPDPVLARLEIVECEVLAGLEPFAAAEVVRRLGPAAARREDSAPTEVRFDWRGPLASALDLRTVVAAHLSRTYAVPRPKGLLGDEHFRRLLDQLATVVALHENGAFGSFRFSAAGRKSAVFLRLGEAISEATGLIHRPDDGDLLLRLRPSGEGWEVLARLSPRPLSARAWRVENLPGALNATIAAAMVESSAPTKGDRVLNAMCGSGTLLIERRERAGAQMTVGVDLDETALTLAFANLTAARTVASLLRGDATRLPFPDGSFDVVLADLPYGHKVGDHRDNDALYRAFLDEVARVTATGGRAVVITHELRRFGAALSEYAGSWSTRAEHQVFQKGHHPKIWVLERT